MDELDDAYNTLEEIEDPSDDEESLIRFKNGSTIRLVGDGEVYTGSTSDYLFVGEPMDGVRCFNCGSFMDEVDRNFYRCPVCGDERDLEGELEEDLFDDDDEPEPDRIYFGLDDDYPEPDEDGYDPRVGFDGDLVE